jgi:hypothetical protein
MKKKPLPLFLIVFLVIIGTILLSGCSGGGNGDEPTAPTTPTGNIWDPFVGLWKGFNGEDKPPCPWPIAEYRLYFDIRLTVNTDGNIDYSVRISEEWGALLEEYGGNNIQPTWTAGSGMATWGDEMALFEGPANGRYEYLDYPWDPPSPVAPSPPGTSCGHSERPDIKINLHR